MKKAWIAVLGLAAAALALPASAQRVDASNAYLGVSLGQAKYGDVCSGLSGFTCDDKDTAFRIFGGYQFTPNLAVELGYADLGSAAFRGTSGGVAITGNEEFTAFDLVGVASWPIGTAFYVYGKLGLYHGEVTATAVGTLGGVSSRGSASDSGTDFTFGLGAGFDVSRNVGLRLEWQRYNGFSDADNLDVFSLGLLYRFR